MRLIGLRTRLLQICQTPHPPFRQVVACRTYPRSWFCNRVLGCPFLRERGARKQPRFEEARLPGVINGLQPPRRLGLLLRFRSDSIAADTRTHGAHTTYDHSPVVSPPS